MKITTKQALIFFAPLAPMEAPASGGYPFPDQTSNFGNMGPQVAVGVGGPFDVPDWVAGTVTWENALASGWVSIVS